MTQIEAHVLAADMIVDRVARRLADADRPLELAQLAGFSAQEVDRLVLLEREGWA